MTGIYWDAVDKDAARLKTYSATTKSTGETSVRIELVSTDPHEAAYILQQLKEIADEQKARAAPASRRAPSRSAGPAATAIPADTPPCS